MTSAQYRSIMWRLNYLILIGDDMAANLDELKAQVAVNTSVEQSAMVLIQGIAARLAEVATDPVAVAKLAADLKASATQLADAVAANTV